MNNRLLLSLLASAACLVPALVRANAGEYADAEIKAKFASISRLIHGDENGSHIRWALHMAGNDTNRFARVLRELAEENTNQTRHVIRNLGIYKTPQSLPFLYSYATNATHGAGALKAIFAIEGVTSNSIAIAQSYFTITNSCSQIMDYKRSDLCEWLLKEVSTSPSITYLKPSCLSAAVDYAQNVSIMHKSLDEAICTADPTYQHSKRRLAVMRAAQNRCWNQMLTNYVTNAINELVAYPEANLPD